MALDTNLRVGRWRSALWPIRSHEMRKFFPLFILYFLVCCNYSILKMAKDALVITAPCSGAEVIPFIKIWVVLPMAFVITYIFNHLANRHSQKKLFHIMIGIFIGFFAIFTFVLYPYRDTIHPHALCTRVQELLPPWCREGCGGAVALMRNWSYTLFYVMSELWGTTILSVLLWGFTNAVISIGEAKRYYGILSVGTNLAAVCTGYVAAALSPRLKKPLFLANSDRWGGYLELVTIIVILVGLLTMYIFHRFHKSLTDQDSELRTRLSRPFKAERKSGLSIRRNFAYLKNSEYLICIAVLVVGFNLSMNLVELVWKNQIKLLHPNPNDFNAYMGKVFIATGWLSTFVGLFLCSNMIRRFGWTISALVTPVIVLVTAACFFLFTVFREHTTAITWAMALGHTPPALGVFLGTVQNIFSRTCKYTLFDATKEIAFIPLNAESGLKGKAAIDGIGSRIGKSGGSLIQGGLLMGFGSIAAATPWAGAILLIIGTCWINATRRLGRKFQTLSKEAKEGDNTPVATESPATVP
ncbi:MAG: Npt1/Npt2 family nucleotide transporter [Simkaniaceae bacterium]|nr:Npt1/Npt2 family nucleotide transporter [Simkaniaceae bacterium]